MSSEEGDKPKGEIGSPDIIALAAQLELTMFKKKPQLQHDPRTINLGDKELTRLWNINPDNLDACCDPKRNPTPELSKFLEEGLDRMEGLQGQGKLSNERYQWMASRFLLSHTDHYMVCLLYRVVLMCDVMALLYRLCIQNAIATDDYSRMKMDGIEYLERVVLAAALAIPELKERALEIEGARAVLKADHNKEVKTSEEEMWNGCRISSEPKKRRRAESGSQEGIWDKRTKTR